MNSTRSWRKLQRASKTEHDGAASDGVVHNHECPGGQTFEKHGEYLRGAARAGAASPSMPAGEGWPVSFCLLLRPFHTGCLSAARAPEYKGASFLVHRDPVRPDVIGTPSRNRSPVLSSRLPVPGTPHFPLGARFPSPLAGVLHALSVKSISLRSSRLFSVPSAF